MDHNPSEPAFCFDDPCRLTIRELNSGYDDDELWGLYLYKKYTQLSRFPISSEMAATMPTRDLEAVICYISVSVRDYERDIKAAETLQNCCHELTLRE